MISCKKMGEELYICVGRNAFPSYLEFNPYKEKSLNRPQQTLVIALYKIQKPRLKLYHFIASSKIHKSRMRLCHLIENLKMILYFEYDFF
jgi:hypothetical protein